MDQHPAQPEPGGLDIETLPSIDVPQSEWPGHSLLRRARINALGDGIEWPDATYEQLPLLREISLVADDGVLYARLARQFNFDRFVDASTDENGPAQPPGHAPDRQRFYTRVTDNGFHVVGVFSAATIAGRRRYFQWLTGAWVEIGLSGFLYVRDDLDTHFSEVTGTQLDETQPGATTTSMTDDEEWTAESMQSQFVSEPTVEPSPTVPVRSMFEPVVEPPIEPLTAATFPHIAPPDPVSVADLLPPPVLPPETVAPEPPVAAQPPTAAEPEPVVAQNTQPAAEPPAPPVSEPAAPPVAEPVAHPAAEPVAPAVAEPVAHPATEPVSPPVSRQEPVPTAAQSAPSDPAVLSVLSATAGIQRSIAMALATVAHRTDVDLVGAATIDHVARVAETFDATNDYIRHCAAWLHDVLERSDLTEQDLLEAGIQSEIVEIVSVLTRREGVEEAAWLSAIAANPDARAVKISAVNDNAAPWRLRRLDAATRSAFEKARAEILAALNNA
ncbi:MAG: hypothetical protein J0H56_01760 [Micrococcales bacterium]|nr:hypothetical protein [Micrococcales bacterium]